MSLPRMAVLNSLNDVVGFIGNSSGVYDDTLKIFLKGSASMLEMSLPAGAEICRHLREGNRIAFEYNGRKYCQIIKAVDQTPDQLTLTAYGMLLEFLNEDVPEVSYSAKTFAQMLSALGTDASFLKIGTNVIADVSKDVSFKQETMLSRLYSMADAFGVELDFRPDLSIHYRLNGITLDVVEKIGQENRTDPLKYGRDYSSLQRSSNIEDLFTAIRPKGKDGLTLAGYAKPDDGYLLVGDELRNPKAWALYPSIHTGASGSGYITRIYSCDASTKAALYSEAKAELQKGSRPQISYTIEGAPIGGIGDRFRLRDETFIPAEEIKVRAIEMEICFTDPTRSKVTYECEEVI